MATDTQAPQAPETHAFQAEVSQLLSIVINSLYTDREVFLRELISNASDALEKVRHELLVDKDLPGQDAALTVSIKADKEANTIEITDTGIGMTRAELVENLGTIAHSGTRAFLAQALEAAKAGGDAKNLIGQFGVGFYAAFMVADRVDVDSLSFRPDAEPCRWSSSGKGEYTLAPSEKAERGTTITLHLKSDAKEFADPDALRDIVRRFSSFLSFPIQVDGEQVNTVQALWTRPKNEITDEEYTEFYKFVANAYDEPRYRLHFSADAPLAINALLFVPQSNPESMGFGRVDPGVDLYCRRVLIQKAPEKFLPEWMRFSRGVVDSDDLPLNISRETMQDSTLVRKISKVIVGRFLKFLGEEANRDAEAYKEFYEAFGRFLKEGVATDYAHQKELAKLLRFETSKTELGQTASLADYCSRLKEGQEEIYYINGPSREAIEAGPYVEALLAKGYEVVYTYDQLDDVVFDHLSEFDGKKLKSADSSEVNVEAEGDGEALAPEQLEELAAWIKEQLGDRVGKVQGSKRLVNNPAAIVTEGMTATMQRLMQAMSKAQGQAGGMFGQGLVLEINPKAPLIKKMHALKGENGDFAKELAEQLFDNAMLAAGLLQDPRAMVDRLNKMLAKAAGA